MRWQTQRPVYAVPATYKILPAKEYQVKPEGVILSKLCCQVWEMEEGGGQVDRHNGRKQTHHGWETTKNVRIGRTWIDQILLQESGHGPSQHIPQRKNSHGCWILFLNN